MNQEFQESIYAVFQLMHEQNLIKHYKTLFVVPPIQ